MFDVVRKYLTGDDARPVPRNSTVKLLVFSFGFPLVEGTDRRDICVNFF